MKQLPQIIKSYIFYAISAFGVSLTITANVGVSSFNAMNLSFSLASGIKVGTITTFFNLLFLIGYMIMTKFEHKLKYLVQGLSVLLFGSLINFYSYTLLADFHPTFYPLRILIIAIGTIIGGGAVGMVIHYNLITFPIESLCLALSEKTSFSFIKYRMGIDIFSIMISLIVTVIFHAPLVVREGTIISMLLLSPSMNATKEFFSKREQVKVL